MTERAEQWAGMLTRKDGEIADLQAEVERLKAWVDDLQSGMYVNCVYCGHRYGPGETTPVSMADALKAHVEQCSQHPMSALKTALANMRAANTILTGGLVDVQHRLTGLGTYYRDIAEVLSKARTALEGRG